MMDPKAMFPDMHHPVDLRKSRDFKRDARCRSRTEAGDKVTYYWVNFSRSQRGWSPRATMKQPEDAVASGDPYAEDVYELGLMISENFLKVSLFALRSELY